MILIRPTTAGQHIAMSVRPLKILAAFFTMMLILISAMGAENISPPQPAICDVGPLNKTFGMTPWLVYSCRDERTVVIVSAPGSPATPYVLVLHMRDNHYQLEGEGTSPREATEAAINELRKLSERDIAELIVQTKQFKKQ